MIRQQGPVARFFIYALLLAGSLVFLIPLFWMISTALKPIDQTMSMPPTWLPRQSYAQVEGTRVPVTVGRAMEGGQVEVVLADRTVRTVAAADLSSEVKLRWGNFREAVEKMKYFPMYLKNTLILCLLTVIGTVTSSALAAYGFARIPWRGRNKVFLLALATMMVPFPVVMVPVYALFRNLGWIGTLKPLWVGSFCAGAFNVFLLRQFFLTIPKDLSEAARIDGCSEFRIFWQIILPLAKPALMVVGLFQFMGTWNDFMGPLIFLTNQKDFTLALGLQFFQSQHGGTEWHYLMAASTLIVLPIILLFFFTQKTFIEGISMTGIKG
jgi:multiple sugar transport system permease protein